LAEKRWTKTVGPAEITKISVGGMDNNVYFVAVGDEVAVVDAGSNEKDAVLAEVGDRTFKAVLQTHNHGDHLVTLKDVVDATGAPVLAHPADSLPVKAGPLADGDTYEIGGVSLKVIHTPGHTPGGICFLLQHSGESHLFAGDTLFPGGPGNTRGDKKAFDTIMRSLDEKLFVLPDETNVYPGHGGDTTIGAERPSLEEWRQRGW
jgi:glyoxylase-like metal-dependent hydrolase (beta-lactamase superfamily II)